MIIGNGNIAKSLKDRDDLVFFASGVSDSSCINNVEFEREVNLLKSVNYDVHLVYFSNLKIYYSKDPYTNHKVMMEDLVKSLFRSYTIVRIEVCAWVNNPTTILNVFKNKIIKGEEIIIHNTTRYVLQKKEFLFWLERIPVGKKNEMNILGEKLHISEIIDRIKKGYL